jgi:type II secretory pathway pseudopilin PulG
MVALLVAMAVTAVWMASTLPAWRQQVQREKEAELIFRGEAIARAIYLYRQKNGQNLPPNLDTLVNQRFLRQMYLDPITGDDFLLVAGATPAGGTGGGLQGGIIGVRSTSNEQSLRIYNNQQTYSQWAFDFTLEQLRSGAGVAGQGPIAPGRGRQQGPGTIDGGGRQGRGPARGEPGRGGGQGTPGPGRGRAGG